VEGVRDWEKYSLLPDCVSYSTGKEEIDGGVEGMSSSSSFGGDGGNAMFSAEM
jgi:hypothetical protein